MLMNLGKSNTIQRILDESGVWNTSYDEQNFFNHD